MAFTYFFRDLQTLELMRDYALPVLQTYQHINIWDAGCAMGPEPYTLAIILRENMGHMYFRNVTIHATDIDECNLFGPIIKKAVYTRQETERIPSDILTKYFIPQSDGQSFQIIDEIRNSLQFKQHDLLSLEPISTGIGLILCKNVLLHFNEEQRIKVITMFWDALRPGGFFAAEQTQKMPKELEHLFEQVVSHAQLFRKREQG
jgi:chemotaxis protein methyltransferase CheR